MNEQEWDEFAEEYYMVQKESEFPIARDLRRYLKEQKLLPAKELVDVAGGAGRYLTLAKDTMHYELIDFSGEMLAFAEQEAKEMNLSDCHFLKKTFSDFLESNQRYALVLSVANPVLTKNEQLERLRSKAKKACLVMRVIESSDDVFDPLEVSLGLETMNIHTSPLIMEQFESYLMKQKIPYKIKDFTYTSQETITRDFLEEYYDEFAAEPTFSVAVKNIFKENKQVISTKKLTYRLLVVF
ncbi:class I SAM-dependent methyltransferase [Enterococcus hirae]|nr:class I SAM-dependent methyltransferase [Enterococcus hirae]